MAITVKLDIISGSGNASDIFAGESLTRVAFVEGLEGIAADFVSQKAREAVEGVIGGKAGTLGTRLPSNPKLMVRNISIQPAGAFAAFAFIRYGGLNFTTMELSGSLSQDIVFRDADGENIVLRYTPGFQAAELYGLTAGKEIPVTGSISKLTPGATISFKTNGVQDPTPLLKTWLGRTNSGAIIYNDNTGGTVAIADPNVWLCTGVRGRVDGSDLVNGWSRIIDFTYKPDTWFGILSYQIRGTIPLDVASISPTRAEVKNGVTVVKIYGEKDFNIPNIDGSQDGSEEPPAEGTTE